MSALLLDQLRAELPIHLAAYSVAEGETGLVIVNEIGAFGAAGAGPFAPIAPDAQIAPIVAEIDRLARRFVERRWPILALVDAHEAGRPEPSPPYPPRRDEHGSSSEELAPELAWLEKDPDVTLLRKDCVNGFVGGIEPVHHGTHGTSRNRVVDWVNAHRLASALVVGLCSDVCVMDFVLTMLSAHKHGMMTTLKDVVVLEPATATYDLPREAAAELGLPATAAHPKLPTHHMSLYFMASRGAVLAGSLRGV
jgi:nicotinamidase-related amidase